ncbi:hypothetical protein NDU88_003491 [Pleurodeles waltl]|uniref:BEN domain-containing protein n=1 Tax=Pleurodeles waltl TaxID=8319 RepID=A0AAV7MQV9_PLEWA|nr:hypothetical protein NDU88_003491 [Pleurodeles waltl]
MASFNVLFFACDRSVCVRKDGEFLLLDNPGEVLCKWLVENIDESGRTITEERDFKAVVLFQSSDLIASYSGTTEGLKQVLLQRAQEKKQLLMDCGSRGSAGRLKRVLCELQEEEIAEKRCKEKNKAKQSGQDNIRVPIQAHVERTSSQPGEASSQINLQKLENLALLAGMASVLHLKSTNKYEAVGGENETFLESPLKFKDQRQKLAFPSPRHQLIPKKLLPTQEMTASHNEVTPTRPCKRDHKMAPNLLTPQGFLAHSSQSHSLAYSEFPSTAAFTDVNVNHTPCHADPFPSNERGGLDDNEESFHLITEESPSFHTGEMVYNSLSIINQNESYSVGPSSCLNEVCVRLQAELNALQAENEHLKAQLQGTCNKFMKSVCRVNGWPSLDNRTMRRKLTIKICNARRGLKKTPHLETNNEVAGFR